MQTQARPRAALRRRTASVAERNNRAAAERPPTTTLGRGWHRLKRILICKPLSTAHAAHERLTCGKALAVFSSDVISSVAYGPEAALLVLSAAGTSALACRLPQIATSTVSARFATT